MEPRLVVDTREDAVIAALTGKPHEVKQLDVGDFIIYNGESPYAIFERKTYADLVASLKDGRLKEQSHRLKNFGCPVVYIIEGVRPKVELAGMPVATIDTIIYGLVFRDGYRVVYTTDPGHTAAMFVKVMSKMAAGDYTETSDRTTAIVNASLAKKTGITGRTCYVIQLSQIPGVSITMAKVIADRFKTMRDLILNATVKELSEIKINNRRLGKIIAARIISYLTDPGEPEPQAEQEAEAKVDVSELII
jgi:ERCC4-type nuclease